MRNRRLLSLVTENGVNVDIPEKTTQPDVIWRRLVAGFDVGPKTNDWPRRIKKLWTLRSESEGGGLVHQRVTYGKPAPPGGLEPPPARSVFTPEAAAEAVDLMLEVVSGCPSAYVRRECVALRRAMMGSYDHHIANLTERPPRQRPVSK